MDITVFGLATGTYLIEDIRMDVPCGTQVTIPAEMALRSKDLWRGINQRQLFQISARPNVVPPVASGNVAVQAELQERAKRLEVENNDLRRRLLDQQTEADRQQRMTQQTLAEQTAQMATIIKMLGSGGFVTSGVISSGKQVVATEDYVSGDAPTFIPGTITPDKADARIETTEASVENASVTGAADKLRTLRQKRA